MLHDEIRKLKNLYHLFTAIAANIWYDFPSRRLKIVGVTGTDGKTTTAHLIYHILKSSGKKVSLVSTVYAQVGDEEYDTGLHTTTPHSFVVQRLLKKSLDAGDEYFVLETTSHALDQNRVFGVEFACSVITNITHEHLDYHKTYDNYLRTKALLLLHSDVAIVNKDDQSFEQLREYFSHKGKKLLTYSLKGDADFTFNYKKAYCANMSDYNNYNVLAAYSVCRTLGVSEPDIIKALRSFQLPKGRLDVVYDGDFKVIVDFAHTPNSIEQLLRGLRESVQNGRLIHVFGAAGLRDALKRPMMGRESGAYADVVVITEEDYRSEDPEKISEQIARGLEEKSLKKIEESKLSTESRKTYAIILNREAAIK
ncbi:UDP-N-acetylmuramyl-tripeptide synthetase, partial [Candidatus Roizmanbacteria bacterium]|nr:UDP-N-acetylmuramyl-tripeptide synthetase [Candidatus Roizmanbacteria bacterium]